MPLAFTQEDFLVVFVTKSETYLKLPETLTFFQVRVAKFVPQLKPWIKPKKIPDETSNSVESIMLC